VAGRAGRCVGVVVVGPAEAPACCSAAAAASKKGVACWKKC